jgi:hypothetical protein
VRLREENTRRKRDGPFRDVVLAAVGEAAFSEELLDIAKDTAISELMKTVIECKRSKVMDLCQSHVDGSLCSQYLRNCTLPVYLTWKQ